VGCRGVISNKMDKQTDKLMILPDAEVKRVGEEFN
jgi:hypothetical protein